MLPGFRLRFVPLSLSLLVGTAPFVGCHKDKTDRVNQAEGEAVKQSFEALKAQFESLSAKFASLRKQVETVRQDLPGFAEVRANFFATEESRGVIDAKMAWLSGRLDSALQSGKSEDLQQLSKDIDQTRDEIHQIDRLHLGLMHQVLSYQRGAGPPSKESDAGPSAGPPSKESDAGP